MSSGARDIISSSWDHRRAIDQDEPYHWYAIILYMLICRIYFHSCWWMLIIIMMYDSVDGTDDDDDDVWW